MGGMTGCLALADGAGPDTDWVGRAAMRVAHRGPDDEGYFADPDLALAFRRLSVIDLSPDVRQPMYSAEGRYVLAFDGEIYNYIELAERLGRPRGPVAHQVRGRGPGRDVRVARQGRRPPAPGHVRLRDLGPAHPGAVLRA